LEVFVEAGRNISANYCEQVFQLTKHFHISTLRLRHSWHLNIFPVQQSE
jgi:hypothetical protein